MPLTVQGLTVRADSEFSGICLLLALTKTQEIISVVPALSYLYLSSTNN